MLAVIANVKPTESQATLSHDENLHNSVDKVNATDQMKRKKSRTARDPQPDMVFFRCFAPQLTALFRVFKLRNNVVIYMLIILLIFASKHWLRHFQCHHRTWRLIVKQHQHIQQVYSSSGLLPCTSFWWHTSHMI